MALSLANGASWEHHSVPDMATNVHNAFELCRQALGVTQRARAKEIGLSVDSVEEALRAKLSPAPESSSAKDAEKSKPKRAR